MTSRSGEIDVYQRRPIQLAHARGLVRLRSREVTEIDYRAHPERYVIGRGEQGVLGHGGGERTMSADDIFGRAAR